MGGAHDKGHHGFVMVRLSAASCVYRRKVYSGGHTEYTTMHNTVIQLIGTTCTNIVLRLAASATATRKDAQNSGRSLG